MKKTLLKLVLAMFACCFATAQDIHFSQFYMSPLAQNPAMAGALHDLQAILIYKNQWKSVASPYSTGQFSFDMKLNKKKYNNGFWAAGINFLTDKAGAAQLKTNQANLSLAYHLRMGDYSSLGLGVQGGFVQQSIGYAEMQWGAQYDGSTYNNTLPTGEPTGVASKAYADLGSGIVWTYNNTQGSKNVTDNSDLKAHLGFSAFHLTQPKYSFYNSTEKLYLKYVAHGSLLVGLRNTNIALVPSFFYSMQGSAQELLAGTMLRYKIRQDSKYTGINKSSAFSLGAFLRAKDAVAVTTLLEIQQFAIGFSYDVNVSGLTKASSGKGGFEVSLRFVNPNPFLYKSHTRY